MSTETETLQSHGVRLVAKRLSEIFGESGCDFLGPPRGTYPLAALALGRTGSDSLEGSGEVAVALELIDAAIIEHYYETDRPSDERLLSGDYRYARAMGIVADLGRPELVATLARATTDVARGHSRSMDEDPEEVLAIRSALWPAAVELAETLVGRSECDEAKSAARTIGIAREAVIAGIEGAEARLEALVAELSAASPERARCGMEQPYIARALLDFAASADGAL